jgi:hypothetical protein
MPKAGLDYCWFHDTDPDATEARQEARRKGGRSSRYEDILHRPGGVATLADVLVGINAALESTWKWSNTPARSAALRGLYKVAAEVIEGGDIERRLEELEASIHAE